MGMRVVKVPGTRERAVAGDGNFPAAMEALPVGPLEVMLPNEVNPHAVAAYVDGEQVGWLQTAWSAKDRYTEWVRKLEAAGITPCFAGELCDRGEPLGRIINFLVPRARS
jgi:hypothetical protein